MTSLALGLTTRSPPPPRSAASSPRPPPTSTSPIPAPRPKFDAEPLKAYMKKLMATKLQTAVWPDAKERERVKTWIKDISERVKERMLEIQPRGFKYVVLTQINENRGQGGRADIVCHWEDSDVLAQEMYVNDSLICVCIALAIA